MKVSLERFSLELDQNNSTAKISISPQANGNVVIPRVVKYESHEYTIVGINDEAFKNNEHVRGIIFPRDSQVKIINKFAFSGTNVESMILPVSVERICEGVFSDCKNLRKVSFDDGSKLRFIDKDAFSWSSIQCLNLPVNVHLKEGWCNGTSQLTQFSVSPESKILGCIGEDFIVGKSKKNLNEFDILYFARRDIENAIIPSSIKRICSFAFHSCSQLKTIQFSADSQLKYIDQYAFSWASLEKIDIPDNVKKIRQFAFSECPELKTVEFSDNSKLQIIKEYAFSSSSLERIKIPAHVNQIGKHAFSWCKHLIDITFSDKSELSSFEKNVFHQTLIESITIPSQICKIGEGAFSKCVNLKTVNFPNDSKLKSIDKNAFFGTSLQKIVMPPSLENLKDGWCWGTTNVFNIQVPSLNKNFGTIANNYIIGKSENEINDYDTLIFARKDSKVIVLPLKIKRIAPYAFDQCQKLKAVISEQPEIPIDSKLPPIPTPSSEPKESEASKENNKDEEEQKNECKALILPQQIDDNAFRGSTNLISVELLGDEVCVGQSSFLSCKNLHAISFPNSCIFSVCQDSFKGAPRNFSLFVKSGAELVNN